MSNYDFSQKGEHDSIWRVLPKGSHKQIVQVLLKDPAIQNQLKTFHGNRQIPPPLSDRVCRLTGDLAGVIARNALLPDIPLATGDDSWSLWRALPEGTETDVALQVMHDPDLTAILATITDEYLVNRISRMCGIAIGEAALAEGKSLMDMLAELRKLVPVGA